MTKRERERATEGPRETERERERERLCRMKNKRYETTSG